MQSKWTERGHHNRKQHSNMQFIFQIISENSMLSVSYSVHIYKIAQENMWTEQSVISKTHVLIYASVVCSTSFLGMLERQKAGHSEVGHRGTFSPPPHLPFFLVL